jgi:hypothetical protein
VTGALNAYVYNQGGLTVTPTSADFPVAGGEVDFTVSNNSGYDAPPVQPLSYPYETKTLAGYFKN